MRIKNDLQQLVKNTKAGKLKMAAKDSIDWFKNNIQNAFNNKLQTKGNQWVMSHLKGTSYMLNQPAAKVFTSNNMPMIGHMYFYVYDPKWKNQLPYYDTFPLVIPIDYAPGGFIGCNFHYLPPMYRAVLLDSLLSFQGTMIDTARGTKEYVRVSYDLLKGLGKTEYKPTIKRYLFSHVKTKYAMVDFSEWKNAVFLPGEQFQKASKQQVWADSKERL
jgi:hypothetical protein